MTPHATREVKLNGSWTHDAERTLGAPGILLARVDASLSTSASRDITEQLAVAV